MKKIDNIKFEGSSEIHQRESQLSANVVISRIKMMLIAVLCFSILVTGRLAYIQFYQAEKYATSLNTYGSKTISSSLPRGNIVDRNDIILATNENSICATYYALENIKNDQIELISNFLAKNLNIDLDSISLRNKKDYFLMAHPDIVNNLITKEEYKNLRSKSNYNKLIYNLKIERISLDLINKHMSQDDIEKTRFYYLIKSCTSGSVVLAENLSVEEASLIGANASLLKGVTITTDWSRKYNTGNNFSSILGKVTTKKQGIPAELKVNLQALDYANDARTGVSGIEKEYENILKGTSSKYTLTYDGKNNPVLKSISEGEKGDNIKISIDWELQQLADQLIENELKAVNSKNKYFNKMFLILMNPNNGEIIVMSGKQIDKATGVVSDYAYGNYVDANAVGSTVKGGVLYVGFKNKVLTPNTYMIDEPIHIKGTKVKKSWKTMGNINEVDALAFSSNVYMFKIAMKLGGTTYTPNMKLNISSDVFWTIRNGLGELGLGVKSGLDVSNESTGYVGDTSTIGNVLDAAIGQFDTYPNIQLATYTATLANKGLKIQPHFLVNSFNIDDNGNKVITYKKNKKIVDDLTSEATAFNQVKAGMRACVTRNDGTCHAYWASKPYVTYSKTGTAEVYDKGDSVSYNNHVQIGYISETENSTPSLVFSALSYRQTVSSVGTQSSCPYIAQAVVDKYVEKYGIKPQK